MRINAATGFISRTRGFSPRGAVRVVEKISAPSTLTRDPGKTLPQDHEQSPRHTHILAYQNGTNVTVPARDAPFFTSPFVAQLLGQVMVQAPAPAAHYLAAARAYGGVRIF